MWEAEPIILCAPCVRGKDPSLFQSPVSAPWHSLMEVCSLQLNSPWWPHQFVVPAFGIVTVLSTAFITNSSSWCRKQWWVSSLPGQKKSGNGPELSSQTDLPAQLPGTPGRLPRSSPSNAPTSHQKEAWRGQLPVSPYLSQTCGSKGEQTFFYHQCGPIEAFHGEFHGEHSILLVSTDMWVLLHVSEVRDGAGIASPWWVLTPSGCKGPLVTLVQGHFSSPQKHRATPFGCGGGGSEILSH